MRKKIVNHLTYYLSSISEKLLSGKSVFTKKNTMLIVRLDSIGDYILFRNFLIEIKNSEKYSGYKITVLGNILWKDIAETFDADCVDNFIWTEKEKFSGSSRWRDKFMMMARLHLQGYEILMLPNDTKTKASEYITKLSGAKKIISDPTDSIFFRDELNRIPEDSINEEELRQSMFQFNRNRKFAEDVTGKPIQLKKPYISVQKNRNENYIVVFPGAGHRSRRWSPENFAEVCRKLWERTGLKIFICGDKTDKEIASTIIEMSKVETIVDLTGQTSLSELIATIKGAKLLLSNETCAVHIAASVNTPAVCISNGNHFGRFNPYPENIAPFITTIYPKEVTGTGKDYISLVRKFHINSDLDINVIKVTSVLAEAEKKLINEMTEAEMKVLFPE